MDEKLLEHIEYFLAGKIEREELDLLAKEVDVIDLDKEIEWVQDMQLVIEGNGLKNQIASILPNSKKDNKVVPIKKSGFGKKVSLSIAAAVVLLFGILFFTKPSPTAKLYSKYEFVDPGIPMLMSENEQYELYDALSYYSEQNYAETITRLAKIKQLNATAYNDTIEYYFGLSNLYDNNIQDGLPSLLKVSEDKNSIFSERAEWMLTLAFVKKGDTQNAKALLQKILDNKSHSFLSPAKELQTELF